MSAKLKYFVIDGAKAGTELDNLLSYEKPACLFSGDIEKKLDDVAPYLIEINDNNEIKDYLLNKVGNQGWGIFIDTDCSFQELLNHLRSLLIVKTEDNRELLFRFYDPRVLSKFIPICDKEQLSELFGPVKKYVVESGKNSNFVVFYLLNDVLITEEIDKNIIESEQKYSENENINNLEIEDFNNKKQKIESNIV
jgi:hypothetical protein